MKTVLMAVGYPGSGKTAYLHNYCAFKPHTIICPDAIRQEITGSAENMSQDAQVWKVAYDRLKEALLSDDPDTDIIALDATFLYGAARGAAYKSIKEIGVPYKLVVIETTLDVDQSLERMSSRARKVPKEVLERMASKRTPLSAEEKAQHEHFEHILINEDTPLFNTGYTAFLGDVHSCYNELSRLLNKLGYWQENHIWSAPKGACKLIFLGDYTDRGPDAAKVLKTIMQLCKDGFAEAIIGNHDDKLFRYLKSIPLPLKESFLAKKNPNKIKLNQGFDGTLNQLEVLTEEELLEIKAFLENLPYYIKENVNGKTYVAVHAFYQDWMSSPNANHKEARQNCLYGLLKGFQDVEVPNRVMWWEDPQYETKEDVVVFGHYATSVDKPKAKGIDLGVCFGREMGAFVTNGITEQTVIVKSYSDWNKKTLDCGGIMSQALTYPELFDKLSTDEKGIIYEIENDPLLNKRRYSVTDENGTYELTIANASKGLFQPEARSYAQQLAKGLVYDKEAGKIVAVTLPKIYNYGEKEAANLAMQKLVQDQAYDFEFIEKADGTQVFRFIYRGRVFWATRSIIISEPNPTVDSDYMAMTSNAVNNDSSATDLLNPEKYANDTLIFELLHPANNTIVHYNGEAKLVFLGASQKNHNSTWIRQVSPHIGNYPFAKPEQYSTNGTLEEAAKLVQELDSQSLLSEGFVVNVLENSRVIFRSKFKTPKFFEAMRLMTHCTYDRVVEVCTGNNLNSKEEFVDYLQKDKESFPEELLLQYKDYYDEYDKYLQLAERYHKEIQSTFQIFIEPMQRMQLGRKELAMEIVKYSYKGHLFSLLDGKCIKDKIHKELKYDLEIAMKAMEEAEWSIDQEVVA
jgi:predicted kinase